ncbi:Hint domain-containing protein, partial [Streptomyces anulatus]|uniref:Hint domain-containing protein n=1 Tax=Streptomyces anulatus TaxID=1892 RepID=UPI00343795B6
SEADLVWWEERFGDSALLPKFKDEDARKWHLLPNGRPIPEGMEDDFWNSSETAQNRFLVLYNVKQMYRADFSDDLIVGYWYVLNPPKVPLAAGNALPVDGGPANMWAACNKNLSTKKCDSIRNSIRQILEVKKFYQTCTTFTGWSKNSGLCVNMAGHLGLDLSKVNVKLESSFLNWIANVVTPLMDPVNEVVKFFIGDAVDCANGDLTACMFFAANFAGPVAGAAAKILSKARKVGKVFTAFDKTLETTAKVCSRSSFLPGTKVLMADGSHKPIEEVKVGDKVLATNPKVGETAAKIVIGLITSKGVKNLVQITVDTDGAKGDMTGMVIATATHPFWLPELREWRTAEELRQGQWL